MVDNITNKHFILCILHSFYRNLRYVIMIITFYLIIDGYTRDYGQTRSMILEYDENNMRI